MRGKSGCRAAAHTPSRNGGKFRSNRSARRNRARQAIQAFSRWLGPRSCARGRRCRDTPNAGQYGSQSHPLKKCVHRRTQKG
jgi:hypothetical protein